MPLAANEILYSPEESVARLMVEVLPAIASLEATTTPARFEIEHCVAYDEPKVNDLVALS